MYRLTVPEMSRLRRGYEVLHDDTETEVARQTGDTQTAARQANPNRTAPGRPREGDLAALNEFKQEHGLS